MKQAITNQDRSSNEHTAGVILCVDISPEELPESIRALMGDHRFELIHCETVYDAMAKIRSAAPVIALVRVDWISTREFEFFSICARSYPQLCIFVLGQDRAQAKIDRAIEHGATARLSAAVIADVVGSQAVNPESVTPYAGENSPLESAGAGGRDNNLDTFASTDNEFDAESGERLSKVPADTAAKSDFSQDATPDPAESIDPTEAGGIKEVGGASAFSPVDRSLAGGQVYFDSDQEPFPAPDVEHAGAGAAMSGSDVSDVVAEDDDTLPAIVPWASSSRRASRMPPKRSKPVVVEDALDDPPLLSSEELSLLLSD